MEACASFTAIATGQQYSCAITALNGTAVCWGLNTRDQSTLPSALAASPVAAVAGSGYAAFTCIIIASDRSVSCWGRGKVGETAVPSSLGAAAALSPMLGHTHACAIRQSDSNVIWCVASRMPAAAGGGQLACVSCGSAYPFPVVCCSWGSPWTTVHNSILPHGTVPADLGAAVQLGLGYAHTCAIRASDRNLVCWGALPSICRHAPCCTEQLATEHTSVTRTGWNNDGQTNVPGGLGRVTAVACGGSHTCVIKESDSSVVCW